MQAIKNKKGKIAFLFTSRNNYQLFDGIFFSYTKADLSEYHIFNIDLNSTDEQKKLAEEVFQKHNITNIEVDPDDPNLYSAERCMELCIEHIDKEGIDVDWVTWFSHDCHLIGDDFLIRAEKILDENPRFLQEVGMIGTANYNTVKVGDPYYGRGSLVEGIDGWWHHLPEEYTSSEYFVVESPQDDSPIINVRLWKEAIKPDYGFIIFNWVEDISQQFAIKNIPCITIPSLEIADLYREKSKYNVSRSLDANSHFHKDDYSTKPWIEYWHKKYGFRPRDPKWKIKTIVRNDFRETYSGTLVDEMLDWHLLQGPKTLDDIGK